MKTLAVDSLIKKLNAAKRRYDVEVASILRAATPRLRAAPRKKASPKKLHWTQRPHNRKRVLALHRKMQAAKKAKAA